MLNGAVPLVGNEKGRTFAAGKVLHGMLPENSPRSWPKQGYRVDAARCSKLSLFLCPYYNFDAEYFFYWIVFVTLSAHRFVCGIKPRAIKRESGENPGQTRYCKFHFNLPDIRNCHWPMCGREGVPGGEWVRRPAMRQNISIISRIRFWDGHNKNCTQWHIVACSVSVFMLQDRSTAFRRSRASSVVYLRYESGFVFSHSSSLRVQKGIIYIFIFLPGGEAWFSKLFSLRFLSFLTRLFHLRQKKRDSYPYPVHYEPGNFTMMYIRDLSFCQIEIFFIFGSWNEEVV